MRWHSHSIPAAALARRRTNWATCRPDFRDYNDKIGQLKYLLENALPRCRRASAPAPKRSSDLRHNLNGPLLVCFGVNLGYRRVLVTQEHAGNFETVFTPEIRGGIVPELVRM